jgi:hypothetical protein
MNIRQVSPSLPIGKPPSLSNYQGPIKKLWRPREISKGKESMDGKWAGCTANSSLEASTVTPDMSIDDEGLLLSRAYEESSSGSEESNGNSRKHALFNMKGLKNKRHLQVLRTQSNTSMCLFFFNPAYPYPCS